MKAILKNGKVASGKLAEVFCKIGIAKPEGEFVKPVHKKEPVKKVTKPKAPAKPKVKK